MYQTCYSKNAFGVTEHNRTKNKMRNKIVRYEKCLLITTIIPDHVALLTVTVIAGTILISAVGIVC